MRHISFFTIMMICAIPLSGGVTNHDKARKGVDEQLQDVTNKVRELKQMIVHINPKSDLIAKQQHDIDSISSIH